MSINSKVFKVVCLSSVFTLMLSAACFSADKIEQYIPDAAKSADGMTLWQTIQSGGSLMIVLALLSIAAVALIIFYFITMKPEKLIPQSFLDKAISLIEQRKFAEAREICKKEENLISNVFLAGLLRMDRENIVVKEAMEDEGRRRADELWQRLSYLADIVAISPMVGLLGTVLGMMQAFNVIVFKVGVVKPVLLANGISKAMVTTAAGLMIAIPAMIFYSFFKGKIHDVVARLENISIELYHLMTDKKV